MRIARALASPIGVLVTVPLLVVAVGLGILLVGRDATQSASWSMAKRQLHEQAISVQADVAFALDQAGPLMERVRALGTSAELPAVTLPDGLSGREAQILKLVARGLSNREIGAALFISEHTAANHIRSILRKTGCANRTDAASYAHRHGLVEA